MKKLLIATALLSTAAQAEGDSLAYEITAGLTTEVGQRLAGSPREAAARDWASAKLKALGFSNVRIEPFQIKGWERGEEKGELIAPYPHRLTLTALGHSGATAAGGGLHRAGRGGCLAVRCAALLPPAGRIADRLERHRNIHEW